MASDLIDFGNGITAHANTSPDEPFLELGHHGLDVPEFDVPVTEHGVSDGGTVGTSRANARHMRLTVWHDGKWTRREVMAAFTPGVQRIISTALGSMPYFVEALDFPESLNEAEKRFSVSLVSPLAYPIGLLLAKASEPMTYAVDVYHAAGEDYNPGGSDWYDVGTTFVMQPGESLVSCSLYLMRGSETPETITLSLFEKVNELDDILITSKSVVIQPVGGYKDYVLLVNKTFKTSGPTTLWLAVSRHPQSDFNMMKQASGTYPNTSIAIHDSAGWSTIPGSLAMSTTRGTPASSTTEVYVTSDTELPCYPKVTVALAASATVLTVSDGTRTAKITGTMAAGAVVVIDSEARSVTVDGTNRIAWFDRTGDWPMLYPGVSKLTTSAQGSIAVEWQPRMMGLI